MFQGMGKCGTAICIGLAFWLCATSEGWAQTGFTPNRGDAPGVRSISGRETRRPVQDRKAERLLTPQVLPRNPPR